MPADIKDLERLTLAAAAPAAARPPAARLQEEGFCVLPAQRVAEVTGADPQRLAALSELWDDLPPDNHLRDGGHYRFRRHGSFVQDRDGGLQQVPHRAHWQPTTYNALHGGMERWFEPLAPQMARSPDFAALVSGLGRFFFGQRPAERRWFIEAHSFRIDTAEGVGRPTPEGAHRDGVDFVVVILVNRHAIRGGETRVFQIAGAHGVRFTLREPWSALLLEDERVIHESTPIQPDGEAGWRDTLVLTYRAGGFLSPQSHAAPAAS
ncbi:MAG: hypothetical protein EPO01_05235 [Aquabacterium sp.]|nr:MAG: hypothetical protein EPO01_05235 [Aquabacterium sp.]